MNGRLSSNIPFEIADVYLDYHVVGPTEDGSQTNVILVVANGTRLMINQM